MCRGLEKSCTEYYRFGFNGKENDKEWGNQLIQDYGFRLYNPAVGKFLSVDPLAPEYPELTTYQFASNSPILHIDLDGLEAVIWHIGRDWDGTKLKMVEYDRIESKIGGRIDIINGADGNYYIVPDNYAPSILDTDEETIQSWQNGNDAVMWFHGVNNMTAFGDLGGNIAGLGGARSPKGNISLSGGKTPKNFKLSRIPVRPKLSRVPVNGFKWKNGTVDINVHGSASKFSGKQGIYVHKFDDGSIYVGKASDLGSRPRQSYRELMGIKTGKGGPGKGYAKDKKYVETDFYEFDSNYKDLDHMEGDFIYNKYKTQRSEGQMLNKNSTDNWDDYKGMDHPRYE